MSPPETTQNQHILIYLKEDIMGYLYMVLHFVFVKQRLCDDMRSMYVKIGVFCCLMGWGLYFDIRVVFVYVQYVHVLWSII